MLSDYLGIVLLVIILLCYIGGWVIVFVCYVKSGNFQYKRSLRHKLKDKSLSQMERDYIRLILSGL